MNEKQIIENLVKELLSSKNYGLAQDGDFSTGWAHGARTALKRVMEAIGSQDLFEEIREQQESDHWAKKGIKIHK